MNLIDPQATQGHIKSELLDNLTPTSDPLDCPISIIPAGQSSTQPQQTTHSPSDLTLKCSNGAMDESEGGQIGRLPKL